MSNMSLAEALGEHKERRRKDSNAIMTMVITQSKTSPTTRQSRLGTDELFMAIDPDTKQLLYYEDKSDKGTVSLDKTLLSDHPSIYLHNDKQVCILSYFSLAFGIVCAFDKVSFEICYLTWLCNRNRKRI